MKPILAPLLFAALALSACADAGAPRVQAPASRIEGGGGGPVQVLRLDEENIIGQWEGVYVPYDPMANGPKGAPAEWKGEPAGVTALVIKSVDGNIIRGRIVWSPNEGPKRPGEDWTSAISWRGDARFMASVIFLKEQDGVQFLESDIFMPDGKDYLHRWVKTAG